MPMPKKVKADLNQAFQSWVTRALGKGVPRSARAFSFNLYEHEDCFAMELIGCPKYDEADPDWACREVFAFREPLFRIPRASARSSWKVGLKAAIRLVRTYLETVPRGDRVAGSKAVVVGFVDGDLHLVWSNGRAVETTAP